MKYRLGRQPQQHTNGSSLFIALPRSKRRSLKIRFFQIIHRNRTSCPYLSGDGAAKLTDYIAFGLKGNEPINLKKLRDAKSIFVQGHLLSNLLVNHWDSIQASSLVTGNSDTNFDSEVLLPPSISFWACQNNAMPKSERIVTLPIGVENLRLGRSGRRKFHQPSKDSQILNRVLIPPMSNTNPIRASVIDFGLSNPELFDVYTNYLDEPKYFKLTSKYRFIFCCEGNGYENHRIWETLYRNGFPILLNTAWSESLRLLNLPILEISKLTDLTPELLMAFNTKYHNFNSANSPALWLPFWKQCIDNAKFVDPISVHRN